MAIHDFSYRQPPRHTPDAINIPRQEQGLRLSQLQVNIHTAGDSPKLDPLRSFPKRGRFPIATRGLAVTTPTFLRT